MTHGMVRTALLTMLAFATAATAAPQPPQPMTRYAVRQGDNLYTLAAQYFVSPNDFAVVQRINRIADPYRIPIGRTLHIPQHVLRRELTSARVKAFSGPVAITVAGRKADAKVGLPIGETGTIETGANAFVTLQLTDGSTVSIPSQSRVQIQRLRRVVLTGSVERAFAIERGRARAIVTPMPSPDSSFHITTPVAVSAVRGTEFRVGYDSAAQEATTEVIEGKVAFASADKQHDLLVPAGFGTSTDAAAPDTPIALLAAPVLTQPGRTQHDPELAFALEPMAAARGYHIAIARDAGFLDVVQEADSATPAAQLPALPDGTYFVRVAATDANGLEGMAETYAFERRLNSIRTAMDQKQDRGHRFYQFRWDAQGQGVPRFRFQLATCGAGDTPLVDETGLDAQGLTIRDLPVGTYCWQVMSLLFADGQANGAWSRSERFHIAATR